MPKPNGKLGHAIGLSFLNDMRFDQHQAHSIEELDFRSSDDGSPAHLTRFDLLPLAAELVFANAPGASVELGWLVP